MKHIPVYKFPVSYAEAHDELELYSQSFKENIACKEAIEAVIAEHYANNRLDTSCVKPLVDKFGIERIFFVLAATVQVKDWDARFSADNKQWAKTYLEFKDSGYMGDRRRKYVVDKCHPGLTDLFLTAVRRSVNGIR